MPQTLALAEHADHLLRFSFIASTHVERPRAGNDQEKMEVPRYRAPPSVCLAEIALGLDLSGVGSDRTCEEVKKAANVSAVTPHANQSHGHRRCFPSAGDRCRARATLMLICFRMCRTAGEKNYGRNRLG